MPIPSAVFNYLAAYAQAGQIFDYFLNSVGDKNSGVKKIKELTNSLNKPVVINDNIVSRSRIENFLYGL